MGKVLPKYEEDYKLKFLELGFDGSNGDFVMFWTQYNDEITGKIGALYPFAYEVRDFSKSLTVILRNQLNLPCNYYSLFNFENEDYLFYDKSSDNVLFIKSENIQKFIKDAWLPTDVWYLSMTIVYRYHCCQLVNRD
ncbi:hypothetical protein V757_02895 [Pelistega indica]|uniref:Uncharacterized protein n=1 Tax=Pelistega indica TaxID=1414851 RepID=V8G8D2_9BURK|nr:hypothetical protein V757_02895 [Pelistega indica]